MNGLAKKFNIKTTSSYELENSGDYEQLYKTLLKNHDVQQQKYASRKKQVQSLKDTIRGQFVKEKLHLENE